MNNEDKPTEETEVCAWCGWEMPRSEAHVLPDDVVICQDCRAGMR